MERDFSMELLPGSLLFSVQGVLFRIPSALLQRHSEVLASMLDLGKSDDDPVQLDDPLEAFRDFRSILLTPLESCLNPSHPTTNDLDRLLELLVLCHKYEAHELEEHVASLVTPLVQDNTLSARPITTSMNVLKVSSVVDRPIGGAARRLLVRDLWSGAICPREVLVFAETISNKKLIGAAYYQIMIQEKLEGLNPSQLQILNRGMSLCGEEWQRIFDSWGQGRSLSGDKFSEWQCDDKWLHDVWRVLSKAKIPWYDVVGKVEKLASSKTKIRPLYGNVQEELDTVRRRVYRFFVDFD